MLRVAAALLSALLLVGCTGPQTAALLADPGGLPPRASVSGVPFVAQEDNYCGPASLAMVLGWSGLPVRQEELAEIVFTPGKEGSFQSDLLGAARRKGRIALLRRDLPSLLRELSEGTPVLVFQNLGLSFAPQWHFAVAYGYDLERRTLLLHSGREERLELPLSYFEGTWDGAGSWALVVTAPERPPASAEEKELLSAAAALERVGNPAAAAAAYRAAAERWPRSAAARLGLGNASYGAGDAEAAAEAYAAALTLDPELADAWNNLAYALAKQGQRTAAIVAAEQAVALGGPRLAAYRDTLREISGVQ